MNKMSFNNEETREAPVPLSGQDVLDQYATIDHETRYKKDKTKKRKRDEDARWHNWRKKNISLSSPIGLLCS
jgi:fructose-1,6-bisphosphatase